MYPRPQPWQQSEPLSQAQNEKLGDLGRRLVWLTRHAPAQYEGFNQRGQIVAIGAEMVEIAMAR